MSGGEQELADKELSMLRGTATTGKGEDFSGMTIFSEGAPIEEDGAGDVNVISPKCSASSQVRGVG